MRTLRTVPSAFALTALCALLGGCGSSDSNFQDFTAEPAQPQTGQTVTFDGRRKADVPVQTVPDSTKVAWDLDGDGTFETVTGTGDGALVTSKAYSTPGTYNVGLDLGYASSAGIGPLPAIALGAGIEFFVHEYSIKQITVTPASVQPGQNQPPMASFEHDADPGHTGAPVAFDATDSTDADGRIVSYEWNFDDPRSSDDTVKAKVPRVTHRYKSPGAYSVRLRAIDDQGAVAETTRMVQVVPDSVVAGSPSASSRAAATRGTPFATTMVPSVMLDDGLLTIAGDAMVRGGAIARGRFTLARRLAAPLNRSLTPRWTAGFMVKQRGHGTARKVAVEAQILIDFGGSDRTCLTTRVAGGGGDRDDGRLTVIGGSGRAARLRGSGTFTSTLKRNGPNIKGRLLFAPARRAQPLPSECRALLRASRRKP
jgi:PKD repeat protein